MILVLSSPTDPHSSRHDSTRPNRPQGTLPKPSGFGFGAASPNSGRRKALDIDIPQHVEPEDLEDLAMGF